MHDETSLFACGALASPLRGALLAATFLVLISARPLFGQSAGPAHASLQAAVDAILDDSSFSNTWWTAYVTDVNTGEVLYARNQEKSFTPASNTKLYTTSSVLDQLGPNYRYHTDLFVDGPVVDGVLKGNLIVRGSGDPVIGGRFNDGDRTETFRQWADSLKALGITRIEGDLIGDDDVFDDMPLGYGWNWDDETYWYAAEVGGLSYNDNNVDFAIESRSTGEPATITWEPMNTDYVSVVNETRTTPAATDIDEGYVRERGTNHIIISSLVPEGQVDYESLTVTNPTLFFTTVLRETLLDEGISIGGLPVDVDALSIKPDYDAQGLRHVARHTSEPMAKIVEVINKRSQNLYAEQVLRTLAAERPLSDAELEAMHEDEVEAGSAEMGVGAEMRTFARAGVDTSRIHLVDGSGLSRMNLVTAEMTMALLRYMWQHPDAAVRDAFYTSLPVGGIDGTLQYRFPSSSPAYEKVRAKTGTLSNVSSLSGYVPSGDRTLAFVLMSNHHTGKGREVRDAQDRIVNLLAEYDR